MLPSSAGIANKLGMMERSTSKKTSVHWLVSVYFQVWQKSRVEMNGRIQIEILDFCSMKLKVSPTCSVYILLRMREDMKNAKSRTKPDENNCK